MGWDALIAAARPRELVLRGADWAGRLRQPLWPLRANGVAVGPLPCHPDACVLKSCVEWSGLRAPAMPSAFLLTWPAGLASRLSSSALARAGSLQSALDEPRQARKGGKTPRQIEFCGTRATPNALWRESSPPPPHQTDFQRDSGLAGAERSNAAMLRGCCAGIYYARGARWR